MAPLLYMIPGSPPVRAVLITAKAIGLKLNEKIVDLQNGDQFKPEFLKINPQHTVPVLTDEDGFTVVDSHAIMTYIVSKYAKNDALYPRDLKKRTQVDQRLHFHSGTLLPRLLRITRPIGIEGKTTIDQADADKVVEAYKFLDGFLEGSKWAAGDFLSIADYSLAVSVGSIAVMVPLDEQRFLNLSSWLKRVQELPEFQINREGQQDFETLFKTRLGIK